MAQTLEKILRDATYATRHPDKTAKQRLDQATQAIRLAIEEIIGEDDTYSKLPTTQDAEQGAWESKERNKLRKEQRANLMKFIEGGSDMSEIKTPS